MPENNNDSLLVKPIADLPFSEAFKQMAAKHKFSTLEELLSLQVTHLHKKKGFSMHVYGELVSFLQQYGLVDKLKQRRGV